MKILTSLFVVSLSNSAFAKMENLEVIEVLAPKQQLSLTTAKQTTDYLDEKQDLSPDRTIADQLVTLPGLSLNGQGGQFQSYAIRGFSRARIRTELDGIPIITDRRAGNSLSFVAPDLISSGYVVKGPSSTVYGAQALGGVVGLSTQMTDESLFKVSGNLENQSLNLAYKRAKGGLTHGLAYQQADKSETPNGEALNTGYERLSGVIHYQSDYNGLSLTYSWIPSFGQDIGKSNVKYPTQEISDYPEEVHSLAQVQVSSNNDWSAKLFHHFQDWQSRTLRIAQYDSTTDYQSHTLGGQWLQKVKLNNASLNWGVDWLSRRDVKINSQYQIFADPTFTDEDFTDSELANDFSGDETNLGFYVQNRWDLDFYQIDLSLRYDWLEQQAQNRANVDADNINGAISIIVPFEKDLTWSFDLSSGFRFPTLSERFFSGVTPRGIINGNPDLQPETSIGGQGALSWRPDTQFELALAVYRYELENYIERFRVDDSRLAYRNLDKAHIQGVELELNWRQSEHLSHRFVYQFQDGENNQGETLADLHPNKLSWYINAEIQSWSFSNGISYSSSSKDVASSELTRKSFVLWDLSIQYHLNDNHELSLKINNVSNTEYYASLDEDATLQPKRNVSLSSTWRF